MINSDNILIAAANPKMHLVITTKSIYHRIIILLVITNISI